MKHISEFGKRSLQPHQQQIVDDFFNVVALWIAGKISIADADSLTGDGWLRHQVIRNSTPDHPQWNDAMVMLDALIDFKQANVYRTDFGDFTMEEIERHGGSVHDRLNSTTGEYTKKVEFPDPPENADHPIWKPGPVREYPPSPYEDEWHGTHDDGQIDDASPSTTTAG
jgi:hypothetical protein